LQAMPEGKDITEDTDELLQKFRIYLRGKEMG
jgi:hypothetical protein